MTGCGIDDIIGHERDPKNEFLRPFRCEFCRIFSGEIASLGVEKSVEISLKSIPFLLAKRSKTGVFRKVWRRSKFRVIGGP